VESVIHPAALQDRQQTLLAALLLGRRIFLGFGVRRLENSAILWLLSNAEAFRFQHSKLRMIGISGLFIRNCSHLVQMGPGSIGLPPAGRIAGGNQEPGCRFPELLGSTPW
jgi:hypothetical protein